MPNARNAPSSPIVYAFTVDEAADYLKRKPDFVYRAVQERRIAFTRAGRELRFSQTDLDAYLAGNRVEAVSA